MSHRTARRIDHYRVLRSDGKPSFSTTKYRVEGDAERICTKPPISVNKTTPLMDSIKLMSERRVRSLVIKEAGDSFWGVVLVEDIMDYLGGGELYDMVLNKFDGDINKAMSVPIAELGRRDYPNVYVNSKIEEIIEVMFDNKIDIVPVLHSDKKVTGVISVHDILRYLRGVDTGRSVKDAMLSFVPTLEYSSTLREALKALHNSGIRFIFVKNELEQMIGYVDYRQIINYFASGNAFRYATKGILEQALLIPIGDISRRDILVFNESSNLTSVLSVMLEKNTGFALVEREERPIGILTEYDILVSLLSSG